MRIRIWSAFLLIVTFLGACGTPKDVAYFQGIDNLTPQQMEGLAQIPEIQITAGDLLNITVSAWDPVVTTPFNPPTYAYAQEGDLPIYASQSMYNYLVDNDGYINFPVLGKIKVGGYTRQELSSYLGKEISNHIKDPLVNVQITNFKVVVMGEVTRPGALTVRNDRITILDAIGQVGDLTINASRTNILVVRENNGEKTIGRIDITQPDVFASPYYYLHQNDVVYVEPNDAKKRNARYSQAQQYNVTVFSAILSTVSVITTVIVAIIANSK
ncbi:polysaccharide biosynthesis/export family protein [Parabacteroides sp. OttesenSCG-928-G07]|nr:polysaccharide biosynthesis/export family protein [Parabacteroides sp. OttesenSCG-928-G21]MDL2277345.1 polysaccharide biosynthesis/export family protein [Parabacteroides sp. OttesenSCG-928-G07]